MLPWTLVVQWLKKSEETAARPHSYPTKFVLKGWKVTECESTRWLLKVCLPVATSSAAQNTQHVRLLWRHTSPLYLPSPHRADTTQTGWDQTGLNPQPDCCPDNKQVAGKRNKAYPGFFNCDVISSFHILTTTYRTKVHTHTADDATAMAD